MIRVIRGKVVGQHLAIEAIDGMYVGRTRVRRRETRLAHDAVIINEDRSITLPQAQRLVADGFESKAQGRRGRRLRFGILSGQSQD